MSLFVTRAARRRLALDDLLPGSRPALTDAARAREVHHRLRPHLAAGEESAPAGAGELAVLAVLLRLLEARLERRRRADPELFPRLLAALEARLGRDELAAALALFSREVLGRPPGSAADGEREEADRAGGEEARQTLLRQLLVYWSLGENPAARRWSLLFDAEPLAAEPSWRRLMAELGGLLAVSGAGEGTDAAGRSLLDELTEASRRHPDSLADQLRHLGRRGGAEVDELAVELTASLDLVAEETAPRFPPGPGPIEPPGLPAAGDAEVEAFTADRSWMPRVVLMAKNVRVWLAQLERRSGRPIERLDQIPDAELDRLAEAGFTALWLIGLWERSQVSRRIKRLCGNPQAEASAYSIHDYRVAADLGGEEALEALAERAGRRGVRLAADMVPNHMGIDSRWLIERPELFLSTERSPFPAYTFDGPDLSPDPRVGIYLEDHYYDRTDAAVVFKRVERATGEVRYVYHGNDGTSTPWNDTAQLDYLNPATRRAVLGAILGVARLFPIIRFDAAMTLAKRHYHRLWFPPPGAAGAIPSRSAHGMSRQELDRRMPQEFWREVVDRVAEESADTLLLAEAFWLMEGYFVRTLGMHRVYNSAFMNMLREGQNDRYRELIRQTLAYDPRILQRYVNFLSNPDERTAIDQFGAGDRYFAACTLLATMPGLPMFGHGQVEGLAEKYGMEFRRPMWDEEPDAELEERHRRRIFPLLARRRLFAGVERFRLFDLEGPRGVVEDVFAWVNGDGGERVLVVVNHSGRPAAGRLRRSAPWVEPGGGQEEHRESLAAALGLAERGGGVARCRDAVSGAQHLVLGEEVGGDGLALDLAPWESRVLEDFRQLADEDGSWRALARHLAGRGVADLAAERDRMRREPLEAALVGALGAEGLRSLAAEDGAEEARHGLEELARRAAALAGSPAPADAAVSRAERRLAAWRRLRAGDGPRRDTAAGGAEAPAVAAVRRLLGRRRELSAGLVAAALLELILESGDGAGGALAGWSPGSVLAGPLGEAAADAAAGRRGAVVVALAVARGWGEPGATGEERPVAGFVGEWLDDPELRPLLGVEEREGAEWVHRGRLDELLDWRLAFAGWRWARSAAETRERSGEELAAWWRGMERVRRGARRGRRAGDPDTA